LQILELLAVVSEGVCARFSNGFTRSMAASPRRKQSADPLLCSAVWRLSFRLQMRRNLFHVRGLPVVPEDGNDKFTDLEVISRLSGSAATQMSCLARQLIANGHTMMQARQQVCPIHRKRDRRTFPFLTELGPARSLGHVGVHWISSGVIGGRCRYAS
jgi:hypothetical protein